jgi:hypothetical protein
LKPKINNHGRRLHPLKKVMKVEEGEVEGNEKSRKNWKDYDVKASIVLCGEMESEFVKNVFKR